MGLFGWFWGKPGHTRARMLPDKVWLTSPARQRGMASEAAKALVDGSAARIVLVAQFTDDLDRVPELVRGGGLDSSRVRTLLADRSAASLAEALAAGSEPVRVMMYGRHPLRSHDEALVQAAVAAPGPSQVVFHLALDDALMRQVSGEWVRDVLAKIGATEDEPIESNLVSRRLEQAQATLAKDVFGDSPAPNAEEWLLRNRPK